jgi:tRNA 2-thiouridine synthesizing protein D
MRFALLVQADPAASPAALSALRFAEAAVASEHTVCCVFFQGDGVQLGQAFRSPPKDEAQLPARWAAVAAEGAFPLYLCVASALRRGVLDAGEAMRQGLEAASLAPPFELAGLATFLSEAQSADRVLTFGVSP